MFIFLESDSFEANSRQTGREVSTNQIGGPSSAPIRRPYRGIQIKEDTYAVLSVRTPIGVPIPLASSSARKGESLGEVSEYSDFILQSVTDERMERQQIIETFGDTFVYFFGERPRMVTIRGMLMNTEDFNWRAQFWHNYDNYLRGSRLVQMNARCYLAFDTIVVEGYPVSASAVDTSDDPYTVPFTMTMLMTDYHEYSVIGDMHFPGNPADDIDVLNADLESGRADFTSTTAEVRRANVTAASSLQIPKGNSALELLRGGVRKWNQAATFLGNTLSAAQRLLSGRAVRVPIGAASYLSLQNEGELAVGSITNTSQAALQASVGANFGNVKVGGVLIPGNKLQIMTPTRFSPSWSSAVTGTSRGMIYENYDEYPKLTQPSSLTDLLTVRQAAELKTRAAARLTRMTAFQQALSIYNIQAAQGGTLSAIADVVNVVKEGYGMMLTAKNLVTNPLGVVTGALGVTPQDVVQFGQGLSKGDYIPGVSMFVGSTARRQWENWVDTIASTSVQDLFLKNISDKGTARIGEVYDSNEYTPDADAAVGTKSYELAYGSNDYTKLVDSQQTVDENTAEAQGDLPAGVERAEPNAGKIEANLDEVYGNSDSPGSGEAKEDPDALDQVYGQGGAITKTQMSPEDRSALLSAVYSNDRPIQDQDVSGITTVDEASAPIEPVV